MYKSIAEAVLFHSTETPDKIAVGDPNEAYTYSELKKSISKAVGWLKSISVNKGTPVLVECSQDVLFIVIDMACQLLGAIFVPLEKNSSAERISGILQECEAELIIADTDYSGICGKCLKKSDVKNAICSFSETDCYPESQSGPSEVLFTTGTTGQPKGIVMSNSANVAVAQNISFGVKMKRDTVELIPLPLSHSHGLRTCYANLLNGSSAIFTDGVTNVGLFFSLIEKYNVNAIDISPTLAKLLLKIAKSGLEKYSGNIDYIEIGTAVLENNVKESLKEIFRKSRLYNFYGSTEAGRCSVLDFSEFDKEGCIGFPSVNSKFMIVDENRNVLESSAANPGTIAVSGDMVMMEYLNSPELTKNTLVNGVIYTNDIGYIDENGRLYIIGRKDDIINYKGIKIAPFEIECVASGYPGVYDCVCIAVEDKICGQVPKLLVQPEDESNLDLSELMNYLKANLEASRVPVYACTISQIPRSPNGKILRGKVIENESKTHN